MNTFRESCGSSIADIVLCYHARREISRLDGLTQRFRHLIGKERSLLVWVLVEEDGEIRMGSWRAFVAGGGAQEGRGGLKWTHQARWSLGDGSRYVSQQG